MPVTNFVWDTVGGNVLSEVDDAGVTTAKYANEPGKFGQLLSQTRGVTNSFYHFDGQGSTRQITNDSQTETDSYTYSAFGEKVASSGTTTNPFQYNGAAGYYTDTETGEVYVRRRTYSPLIARWLSVDQLKFVDGPNNYSYVRNHPTGYVDPSGNDLKVDIQEKAQSWIIRKKKHLADTTVVKAKWEKNDVISEYSKPTFGGGCEYCADVEFAKEMMMEIEVRNPSLTLEVGSHTTTTGRTALAGHEARRVDAFRQGYDYFLEPSQKDGINVKRCNSVCRPVPGVAKSELERYLDALRTKAVNEYGAYANREQAAIATEANFYVNAAGGPLRRGDLVAGYSWTHTVVAPAGASLPDCPAP